MLAHSRANTQRIEELIARKEGTPTAELHQRRRRIMRIVPWASAANVGAARRGLPAKVKAAMGVGAVAGIVAALMTVAQSGVDRPRRPHAAPRASVPAMAPPFIPAPPRAHAPPRPSHSAAPPPPAPSRPPARGKGSASSAHNPPPGGVDSHGTIASYSTPRPMHSTNPRCLLAYQRPVKMRLLCRET